MLHQCLPGLARPIAGWSGPCDFSHLPACPWNANRGGTNVYTVEFVRSDGTSTGYKPTVITAATPAPTGQRRVDFQTWVSSQTLRGQPRVGRRGAVVRDLRRDGLWPAERHPAGVDLPDDDLGPTDDPDRLPGWDDLPGDPGPTPVRRGGGPLSGHQGLDPSTPSYSCAATVPMPTGSGPPWTGPVVIALDNYGNALYQPAVGVFLPPAACIDPKTGQPISIDPGTGQFTTRC